MKVAEICMLLTSHNRMNVCEVMCMNLGGVIVFVLFLKRYLGIILQEVLHAAKFFI
jgi:hypothetical protein